jgi:AcrR family transcriptional regulator
VASANDTRRTRILLEAAHTFVKNGYDGTSMSTLAERCDITKPGLYYHFKSKQDLLFAIMTKALDVLEETTLAATLAATSHTERLRSILAAHARLITEEKDGAVTILVIEERAALPAEDRRMIEHRLRSHIGLIRATLEGIRAEGKLRNVDTGVAALSLLGTVVSIARWFRPGGRLNADQVVEQVIELALGAVLRDGG